MFDTVFTFKKEIGKFKVSLKNSLGLTAEKVTQNPRTFNTKQIQTATDNIQLIDIEEKILPDLLQKTSEFILKDFFLFMHQTGLYNRQLKFWHSLANITQVTFFKLEKGLFKRSDLNASFIYFYIDPQFPSSCAIVDNRHDVTFEDLKSLVFKASSGILPGKLKGILYFLQTEPDESFINKLKLITDGFDPISKYESRFNNRNTRLNLILWKKDNDFFTFTHIYPELKSVNYKLKVEEQEINTKS